MPMTPSLSLLLVYGPPPSRLPSPMFPMCSRCHEDVSVGTGWKVVREKLPCVRCNKPTKLRVYLVRDLEGPLDR
jgi:hypothetical protein